MISPHKAMSRTKRHNNILLVHYCCIADYHKFNILKQHPIIISIDQKSRYGLAEFPIQGLTRVKSRSQLSYVLSGAQDPLPSSCCFGRSYFLMIVVLRSSFLA